MARSCGGSAACRSAFTASADGRSLLVGGGTPGDYGELAIVALAPADQARVLGTFEDVVLGVSTSRDGGRVAGCSADGSLRVYDTESGQMLWEQVAHSDWATAVSFDHEGTRIASASKDKTVKVFDAATGELFVTYMGHRKQFGKHAGQFEVFDVVFDEASRAYSAGEGPAVRLWDPAVAREENGTAADMEQRFAREGHTQYIVHGHKHPLLRLAVTVESVYCASGDGVVTRHDRATLERTGVFEGLEEWVTALAVHAPGQRLAAGTLSGQVRIWDVQTGELLTEFTAAPGYGVKDAAARR
jgi:WD40 repeat protein